MVGKIEITYTLNGEKMYNKVSPNQILLDFIREHHGLTGTKEGCGEGDCGACSIIMDGKLVNSCLVFAYRADNSDIITIEGLQRGEQLHPLQKSFLEEGAVQCGFCTPGILMASKIILDKYDNPTEDQIKEGISGNLCRCTGYKKIVKAVKRAATLE